METITLSGNVVIIYRFWVLRTPTEVLTLKCQQSECKGIQNGWGLRSKLSPKEVKDSNLHDIRMPHMI